MPKRGDNIRKRKDGRWEGRYKVGVLPSGQTKYRSVYGKTYSDVKLKLISEKNNNTYNTRIKKRLRFNELIEKWMASSSIRFKGATENKYWTIIDRHINPILGSLELSQITPSLINEFLNDKLNNGRIDGNGGLSPSYVNTIRIIMLSAVQFGVSQTVLATKVGMSRQMISLIERGKQPMTWTQFLAIVFFFKSNNNFKKGARAIASCFLLAPQEVKEQYKQMIIQASEKL